MRIRARMAQKYSKAGTMDETMNIAAMIGNTLLALLAWVITYTGLPAEPAAILAGLMFLDFVAGISRAHVMGEPVTSHRMKVGAISKCSVMTVPLVMALAARGLGADFQWLVNWTISLFILSETYSVIANVYTARTGQTVTEWDAMSIMLRKLRDVMDKRQ